MLKPNMLYGRTTLLRVAETESSSLFRRYLATLLSKYLQTQVLGRFATVKCQESLESKYCYKAKVFCRMQWKVCFRKSSIKSIRKLRFMHIIGLVKVKMTTQIAKRITALYSRNKNSVYNQFRFELGGFGGRFFSAKCNAFVNPDFHASPFTPHAKAIKQTLIVLFLTTNNCSIISKLKPVNRNEGIFRTGVTGKPKLLAFLNLYMVNEGI